MPWSAIAYVTSGLTLIAFVVAIAAWVQRNNILGTERRIRLAPPKERAQLVEQTLEFFKIDTTLLTKEQQYDLAIRQIEARAQRFRIIAGVVSVLFVVTAAVAIFAIARQTDIRKKEDVSLTDTTSSTTTSSARTTSGTDAIETVSSDTISTSTTSTSTTSTQPPPPPPRYEVRTVDVPLSKELEVSSQPSSPVYGAFNTWQNQFFADGVMLITPLEYAPPSSVKYKIPSGAQQFTTVIGPAKERCDTGNGGVNGWTITIKTLKHEEKKSFQYSDNDKTVEIPLTDVPEGQNLTIALDIEGYRNCDRAVLGDPHFIVRKRVRVQ